MDRYTFFKVNDTGALDNIRRWIGALATSQVTVQEHRFGDNISYSVTVRDYVIQGEVNTALTDTAASFEGEFGASVTRQEFPTVQDTLTGLNQ